MTICANYSSHQTFIPRDVGACPVLNEMCNGNKEGCPFYKTPAKAKDQQQKCNERLVSLSETDQAYIADKYYGSRLPWNPELEVKLMEARKNVS